jgi:hypothetical protein
VDHVEDKPVIYVINGMPIANVLVQNIWRLMLDWNLFKNWYRADGAFVAEHPEVQIFVRSYFHEPYATVAVATLCSAVERLLRAALKREGLGKDPIVRKTLPKLLKFCISADRRFFNIHGCCCDVRSINRVNALRIGAEHGDHFHDQKELARSGWRPDEEERDAEYLKIMEHRLLSPHHQLCRIFDQVDPETGLFRRNWEPREFDQCKSGLHDEHGVVPDE